MILSVRREHRNKSVPIHENRSFPKDCEEYTTYIPLRQAFPDTLLKLLELDNGRERFAVAVRKDGVVWLPEYALLPYLFVKDDPKLPLAALTLDEVGSKVILDAVEMLLK